MFHCFLSLFEQYVVNEELFSIPSLFPELPLYKEFEFFKSKDKIEYFTLDFKK